MATKEEFSLFDDDSIILKHIEQRKIEAAKKSKIPQISEINDYLPIQPVSTIRNANTKISKLKQIYKYNNSTKNEMLNDYSNKSYKNEKSNYVTIGPLSTLEYLIESKKKSNESKESLLEHFNFLDNHVFRWRSISGDGNCFYRSVIFSYIELIILEGNVSLLENLILEFSEMINLEHSSMKILDTKLKKELISYSNLAFYHHLFVILDLLRDGGDSNESKEEAYKLLIKFMNHNKNFDLGLVVFFRFKIYNFILAHSNKKYTTNFPVLLGNLLPSEYETMESNFLFSQFYDEYLLKLHKDAEKIVIYLTPFVLKINLNLVIYEATKSKYMENKEFSCYLDTCNTINLLYKDSHYDIVIDKITFNKFHSLITTYSNFNENLKILTPSNIIDFRNNQKSKTKLENKSIEKEEIRSIKVVEKEVEEPANNLENIEEKLAKNLTFNDKKVSNLQFIQPVHEHENESNYEVELSNYEPIHTQDNKSETSRKFGIPQSRQNFQNPPEQVDVQSQLKRLMNRDTTRISDSNTQNLVRSPAYNLTNQISEINKSVSKTSFVTVSMNSGNQVFKEMEYCKKCKQQKQLIETFDICCECLIPDISKELTSTYNEYLKQAIKLLQNQKPKEVKIEYEKKFYGESSKDLNIQGKKISLSQLEKLVGLKFPSMIIDLKQKKCLICFKISQKIEIKNKFTSTCGCITCSKACKDKFYDYVIKNPLSRAIICICGYEFQINTLTEIYYCFPETNPLKKHIKQYIQTRFNYCCFECLKYFNPTVKKVSDSMFFRITLDDHECESMIGKLVEHISCMDCYNDLKIKREMKTTCKLCCQDHYIMRLEPIAGYELNPNKLQETGNDCIIF